MAKQNKEKQYTEAELIVTFGLTRTVGSDSHPLLQEWLQAETTLSSSEIELFEDIYEDAHQNIAGWQEEDLKMKFISFVLRLGHLKNNHRYHTYFEKTVFATVTGIFLKTKTDFMVAKGVFNMPQVPYFHFQEYKPQLNPTGESMAQLVEAFLIAQTKNANGKPLYGCEVIGKQWSFVLMEGAKYYVSDAFDATKRDELLQIIAILRKFKLILETHLLD
ncbi:MAG: hypothetical protein ACKVTZ_03865 [Bacteroidia bacterium]